MPVVLDRADVMHDPRHLTVDSSASLAPQVDVYLKSLHLIP